MTIYITRRILYLAVAGLLAWGCEKEKTDLKTQPSTDQKTQSPTDWAKAISEDDLKKHLYTIASDEYEGRFTGLSGEEKTIQYLRAHYTQLGIKPLPKTKNYLEHVPQDYIYGRSLKFAPFFYPLKAHKGAHNLVAYIPGKEAPNEYIVVSAHMDHMGQVTDSVFMFKQGPGLHNGADDNGSGTVAVMMIAKALKAAADKGYQPKRSIVFVHFTAEELGLIGSKYFVNEGGLLKIPDIVANINLDMVGVNTDNRKYINDDHYVYVIGSDKSSSELKAIQNKVNSETTKMKLDYSRDDPNHKDNTFARSDHYNFALKNIPVIMYHSGLHSRYHTPKDDPQFIAYKALQNRTKLAFHTIWELANREKRLVVDKTYTPAKRPLKKQGKPEIFRCIGHP